MKIELEVVTTPLPKELEAAYWSAIRFLVELIRLHAGETNCSKITETPEKKAPSCK
ncbi:MAG: hypothetical protein ACOYYU_10355 [Chloroflexota bacterium]